MKKQLLIFDTLAKRGKIDTRDEKMGILELSLKGGFQEVFKDSLKYN